MRVISNSENCVNRELIFGVKKDFALMVVFCVALFFAAFVRGESPASVGVDVETTRSSNIKLKTPQNKDSFKFLIFADRTDGQPEDIAILKDAVIDANRFDPDFVMNIGDMIQGYNSTEVWLQEMNEYKAVMDGLNCEWFPTAGNHDVYGGKYKKELGKGEHDKDYETYFAPFWYAFEYKNYWFIVLFTDEGNPETGAKNFRKPECQIMSDAQFNWLKSILKKAKKADGVFVFQHHPRWFGNNYGDDWDKVHAEFVKAGNVKAVFAGHIHKLTYNEKDNIQYYTLATTGGNLKAGGKPNDGYIHEIHHVSVRKNAPPKITAFPVNTTIDIKAMPSKR
jgi:UDP-2,3-diacylglucosamine pyrophosphatase LpxH